MTPKFELGQDLCSMHLHPQVSSSYVYSLGSYRVDGRVAVDVTALRRLWQHLSVLGLVILACVPVYSVLRVSYCCGCVLSTTD